MENKKKIMLVLSLTLSLISLVYAQNNPFIDIQYEVGRVINQIFEITKPVLETIMGEASTAEFFFHKVLLLILLIVIIKNIIERTPIGENNKNVSWIIALIVSVLGIRFINENRFFMTIFLQYGVLSIAITTLLPMIIFFYFIHNTRVSTFGRKVSWTLYVMMLTLIWISKLDEIPEVANYIYIAMIASIVVFILADKSIHSYLFGLSNFRAFERNQKEEAIIRLRRRMNELTRDLRDGIVTNREYERRRREIQRQIRELSRE